MKSSYKRLGDFVREINTRNADLSVKDLLGINIDKFFMPSVANIIGTDLSNYKIVQKNQFACNRMHVGRDERIPIAISRFETPIMVSPAYDVFEIIDPGILNPEYLMMWFSRKEFDRNAWFYTDADVRGGLPWDALMNMRLPIPSPKIQREIVAEYQVVQNRMALNKQLIQKLEETAQALYKQWFVDFEFPNAQGQPYKSSGGEMVESELGEIPKGWAVIPVYDVANFINGTSFNDNEFNTIKFGLPVVRIAELKAGITDDSDYTNEVVPEKYYLKNEDVLYSWSGNPETSLDVFKWLHGNALLNQHIFKITENGRAGIEFIYYMLMNLKPTFVKLAEGKQTTGLGHITVADLKELQIAIPPQKELDVFLEDLRPLFNFDTCIQKEQILIRQLSNLLLSKLATVEEP